MTKMDHKKILKCRHAVTFDETFYLSTTMNKVTKPVFSTLLLLCFTLTASTLVAQTAVYKDTIYDPDIRSVVLEKPGLGLSYEMAVIPMNGGRLTLEFDDLGPFEYDYYYEIIHCTRDWRRSPQLLEVDYLDGYNGELIDRYEPSQAVYSNYMHYKLDLPNDFTSWKLSGNYIINVYADDEDQSLLLTRRFVVVEQYVPISVEVKRPINRLKMRSHVEMDIDINLGEADVFDPQRELTLDIYQNGNWQESKTGMIGQTWAGDVWKYNYTDSITFKGYKEFREFDIRSLNYTTEFVSTIDLSDVGAEVYIFRDKSRNYQPYLFRNDADGNRVFTTREAQQRDPDVWGEYVDVTFTLEFPEIFDGDVYLMGKLTDWDVKDRFKMSYVSDDTYKATVQLKQGYYNYMYVVQQDNGVIDMERLEGSTRETNNNYTFLVYYAPNEGRYDRCIGYLYYEP